MTQFKISAVILLAAAAIIAQPVHGSVLIGISDD